MMGATAMRANASRPCQTASVLDSGRIIIGTKRLLTKVKSTIQGPPTQRINQPQSYTILRQSITE